MSNNSVVCGTRNWPYTVTSLFIIFTFDRGLSHNQATGLEPGLKVLGNHKNIFGSSYDLQNLAKNLAMTSKDPIRYFYCE